jgi:glycerate 2-kinase
VHAALRAADADRLTRVAFDRHPLPAERPFHVIAAGKASAAMTRAAIDVLGDRLQGGVVIGLAAIPADERFRSVVGEHPQPGEGSVAAGRAALALARRLPSGDHLLVLLSGGASSLMAAPAPGLTLADKRTATGVLLRAGADITALNAVRKHLSAIKGGQLAAACAGATTTFAISDVVGNDLSVIGSGPTVPDTTSFGDALAVIDRFGGRAAYPPAVVRRIVDGASGALGDTPKPDGRSLRANAWVIGSRDEAMRGAAREAEARGFRTVVLTAPVVGEARRAGEAFVAEALAVARAAGGKVCVIASGETTVTVRGQGRGGRNQELALAASRALSGAGHDVIVASVGTDGVDGPTDAAGAIADTTTLDRARQAGLVPQTFLDRNDSNAFFAALGDLIHTGPTGTNVGDLQILLTLQ